MCVLIVRHGFRSRGLQTGRPRTRLSVLQCSVADTVKIVVIGCDAQVSLYISDCQKTQGGLGWGGDGSADIFVAFPHFAYCK